MDSIKAKKGGRPHTPNRQGLYAKFAKHADLAIDTLAQLLQSRNENIRLGAARVILDKVLPDLKAIDARIQNEEPIKISIVASADYIASIEKLEGQGSKAMYGNTANGFLQTPNK